MAVSASAAQDAVAAERKALAFWFILALIMLAGLALRLYLLLQAQFMIDYDEAVIGLEARHIAQGAHPVFLYGVPYMGVLESYLAAPLFKLFGVSKPALKAVPLAFSLAFIVTAYLMGQSFFGSPRAGLAAAALSAVPPLYMNANTLKAWGATIEIMVFGHLILLLASEVAYRKHSTKARLVLYGALGFLVGLSFWVYWLIAYYVVVAAFFLVLKDKLLLFRPHFWILPPAFLVGSLPFWAYNLRHDMATFHFLFGRSSLAADHGPDYGGIFRHFLEVLVPWIAGADQPGTREFPYLREAILGLLALALLWLLLRRWKGVLGWPILSSRPSQPEDMLILFTLALPVIYVFSGPGEGALNPYGIDAAGRYAVPFFSAVSVALGAFLWRVGRFFWPAAALLLALLLGNNLYAHLRADPAMVFQSPYYNRLALSNAPLIDYLRSQGIDRVWTDVGISHVLMFETKEEIIAADYRDLVVGKGIERFPAHTQHMLAAERTAFVYPVLAGQVPPLEKRLIELGVGYSKKEVPPYAVFIPNRRVDPMEVVLSMGYQY